MSDVYDIYWAAGLFEGEGWFTLDKVSGLRYPSAGLSMTDEETVRRFHEIVGVGTVIQESARGRARRAAWRWKVCNREGFHAFAELLGPHLGTRRRGRLAEVRADATPVQKRSRAQECHA